MIDLETFIESLKITWIKRFIESDDNGILNKLYMNKLHPFGENFYLNAAIRQTTLVFLLALILF